MDIKKKFMKTLYTLVFLLLVLTLLSSKGNAQMIISIDEDTYTSSIFKNNNYGGEEFTKVAIVGGVYTYISYLQFDFTDFKGYLLNHDLTLDKFDLCIYPCFCSNSSATNFSLTFIALDKSFDENVINYNSNYRQYWINNKNVTYDVLDSDLGGYVCFDIRNLIINEVDDYLKFVVVTDSNEGEYLMVKTKEYGSNYAYIEAVFERKIMDISAYDLSTLTNVVFLFVLVFAYLGVMILGFTFKNGGFVSFGFFIGIVLGFMLSGFHMFLTLLFFFMNISIMWVFIKKGR